MALFTSWQQIARQKGGLLSLPPGNKFIMLPLDAVDMKRIILFTVCLLCLVGSASAYQCISMSGIRTGWPAVKLFG